MSIGLVTTKQNLDNDIGLVSLALRNAFRRIEQLRHYFLITPDATLVALGYTQAEVTTIKSAFVDGDTLRLIWEGTNALPVAQDFRVNMDQLAGDLVT